ncbi:hypothetical protein EYZ11_009119 [Aspergillus tanneri]|uniref:Blue light receptor n=1 Tax=Aspergillus tanneri TaxID=1220188 RepID=A0A4S3JAW8_9EURO|nr:hypothetical protein EYZ11_009119 [Aspergillus tanneri]
MEGFHGDFYDHQYYWPPSENNQLGQPQPSDDQHGQMMSFTPPDQMQVENFAYQAERPEMLAANSTFMFPLQTPNLPFQSTTSYPDGPVSNVLFPYDPHSAMQLASGNPVAYNTSFPSSLALELNQNHSQPLQQQRSVSQFASFQSQAINLDHTAQFATMQPQGAFPSTYWAPSHPTTEAYHRVQLATAGASIVGPTVECCHRPSVYSAEKAVTSEGSSIDIPDILAEVVSRPDSKIKLGTVDLSCAFVLCDISQDDQPIVYVSEAFQRLTGYSEGEIIGRNCRFLQGPDGMVQRGMQRTFVDPHTAFRLRSTIEDRMEIQTSMINYRKGGQPFVNLITMIPVRWNSGDYRFYVGFQVDLVEKPNAVTSTNPDGTYMINYQRTQLPNYVAPPPDIFMTDPDLAVMFGHEDVSTILDRISCLDPSYKHYLDRVLIENTDDVIHVLSFESEFLYLSASCRNVLEYEPAELVGKTLSTVCHPSDIGPITRDLRASTNTDPVSVVYRIRKKYGGYIWFESHGSWHIADRKRRFMVLVGRVRPVYCLDELAKVPPGDLAESDLWAKLSPSGIILFMSSRTRAVLGRMSDTLVGKSIQELTDARGEAQRALGLSRNGQPASFRHKIRHRKGHMLPVHTTLYPGDTTEGCKPSFLAAKMSFPKATGASPAPTPLLPAQSAQEGANQAPAGNHHASPPHKSALFPELMPTRGTSWQVEFRDLEKENRTLSEELQQLLARKKKRKRKLSSVLAEKSCAMCQSKRTPEWRRGPSGNRDLCNSCGLRWAKQVRNAAQAKSAERFGGR